MSYSSDLLRFLKTKGDINKPFDKIDNLILTGIKEPLPDFSEINNLKSLYLKDSSIMNYEFKNLKELTSITLENSFFSKINFKNCKNLKVINLISINTKSLNIENCSMLEELKIEFSEINNDLDFYKNKNLKHVNLCYNRLKKVDLSKNNKLNSVKVIGNNIGKIDIISSDGLNSDIYNNEIIIYEDDFFDQTILKKLNINFKIIQKKYTNI